MVDKQITTDKVQVWRNGLMMMTVTKTEALEMIKQGWKIISSQAITWD